MTAPLLRLAPTAPFRPLATMSPVPPYASGRPAVAARLRFCTLGAALVHVGGVQVTPSSGVLFALLVRLAHSPGQSVTRDQLVAELWPGFDPVRQRANLRQALYKLRSMGVRISAGHAVVALDAAQVAPSFALERSAALFKGQVLTQSEPFGPFLPGFVAEGGEFAEWVELQRGVVHGEVRHVLVAELRQRRDAGDWGGTEAVARGLLRFDPLNEEATLQLAECVMLAGAKAEALAILDRYLAELGAVPAEVRERAQAMRRRFQDPPPRRVREREAQDRHFVGRVEELAQLTQALRRARWQDGGAVLVHGAPGIGKTRLTQALSQVSAGEGFREVRLACRDGDQLNRYHLLAELVQRLLALPGALGCEPASMRRLRAQWPEPGGTVEVPPLAGTDGDAASDFVQQAATREALLDLMAAVAEERPLLLVVEDVHWLDAGSWQVLQLFASATGALRLLLVCTARERTPQPLRGVATSPRLAVLALGPLAPAEVAALADGVAAEYATDLPAAVGARLAAVSEGNPLFLRALVQHWVDTGEAEGVPGTLTQLLEARLDRLPATALTVLQTIVALGPLARVERLREAVGVGTLALVGALEELERADCIRSVPPYHVASHDLVGRLAWGRLSGPASAVLAGAVAEVLEREYRQTSEGALLPAVLAGLAASGRGDRFGRLLEEAQGAVLALGNPAPVLQLAERLAADGPTGWMRDDVRRVLAQLQAQAGNYAESLRLAGGVMRLPEGEGALDERTAAAMLTYLESAYRSDVTHDVELVAEAVTRLCELRHLPLPFRVSAAKIGLIISANQASIENARRCFAVIGSNESDHLSESDSRFIGMIYHTTFGDTATARSLALSLANEFPRGDLTAAEINFFNNVGFALRYCNEVEVARKILHQCDDAAISLHLPRLREFSLWQLASIHFTQGDIDQFQIVRRVLERFLEDSGDPGSFHSANAFLLRVCLWEGNREQAQIRHEMHKKSIGSNASALALAYTASVELAVSQLDIKWCPEASQVEAALSQFQRVAPHGFTDYFLAPILEGLVRIDREQEAIALAFNFVHESRRQMGALGPELSHMLRKLRAIPTAFDLGNGN
ncbi:MAG: AAA family ATPase [Gemmatimonadetes bacterium]|nr:AAA family ATPase [Gemmatimonadota bacterium]